MTAGKPRRGRHPHAAGRWRGLALAIALGSLAAACTSQGQSTFQRIAEVVRTGIAPPEREPAPEVTRAQLNEIPFATIRVSFGQGGAYLVPLADNEGYLDYRDAAGRSVRMHDGLVVATEGAGIDLKAVRFGQGDPVANRTPLADWPDSIFREYQYKWLHGEQYGITLACKYQRLASETIEIVEIDFDVVRVVEVCTNQARQVVNTYWVEAETGFIWRSEQWLGPRTGTVEVDIIRPYGG